MSSAYKHTRGDVAIPQRNKIAVSPWRPKLWDGGEKFYEYDVWLEYLIQKILQPNGYTINGEVRWEGEDHKDLGTLIVTNNVLKIKRY